MADYYPLIARAVEALSVKSPDLRRAVYERARSALTDQLRALDPPVSEADIAREQLSLDRAIDQVEARYQEAPAPPALSPAPEPPDDEPPSHGTQPGETAGNDWPEAGPPMPPVPVRPRRPERPARDVRAVEAEQEDEESAAPQRDRPRVETIARRDGAGRARSIVLGLAVLLAVAAIAVTAWLLRDKPSDLPQQPATAEAPSAPEGNAKFGERVAGERTTTPAPSTTPAGPAPAARSEVPVAQRAVLYEENQADPQTPRATAGRAVWRLDAVNAGQGRPLETVIRGTVEIPGANLTLNLVIRRNLDPALPASHTVELSFTTSGEAGRAIRDVGLLQLKSDEAVRGTPLAGLPVPVKDNVFLLGLSNLPGDVERNTELLLKRNWIDLPIRFASGSRAVLSFEKGVPGEQAFNEAFRQWGGS